MRILLFIFLVSWKFLQAELPLLSPEQISLFEALYLDLFYLHEFPSTDYFIHTRPDQTKFLIDNPNDCIKSYLSRDLPWEKHVQDNIQKYTKPGSIVIDIGAHIGSHTIALSKAVGKEGIVIAFEPQKKICRELLNNLELNGCSNVFVLQCALGNHRGMVYLGEVDITNEGSRYISEKNSVEGAPLETLDSFQLSHVSLIKIDAENYEYRVLEGARDTILRNRPVILIEIMGNSLKSDEDGIEMPFFAAITIDFLKSLGYEVTKVAGADYLALPKEIDE